MCETSGFQYFPLCFQDPTEMSYFDEVFENQLSSTQMMTHKMIGPSHQSDRGFDDYIGYNYINYNNCNSPFNVYKMTVADLETEVAAMSSGFPALQGALVGQRISSHAITEEYARADPVYVQKTIALSQIYSHYRAILGDGNCGWRAVGFAYFETLLRQRSKARLEEEMARMSSLTNLMTTAGGFEAWLFEDMVGETIDLLRDLSERVEINPQEAETVLIDRFNNPDVSNSIIYHFRLLASSWLKANPNLYEGFIMDGSGAEAYSKNYIEPVNLEIEHLIMCLLIDVLLKPIGIAVEIVYLDRTPGSLPNTHVFQQEDALGVPKYPDAPVIHLLFRPCHYDILYRDTSNSSSSQSTSSYPLNVQAYRAFTEQHVMQSAPSEVVNSFLLDTPLFSNLSSYPKSPDELHVGNYPKFANPTKQTCLNQISPSTSPTLSVSSSTFSSSHPTQGAQPFHSTTPTFSQFPVSSDFTSSPKGLCRLIPSELLSRTSTSSFRPSKYELAAASDWQEGNAATQSPTFKSSHYNTAHFNNANFQPEQWAPESDEAPYSQRKSTS